VAARPFAGEVCSSNLGRTDAAADAQDDAVERP